MFQTTSEIIRTKYLNICMVSTNFSFMVALLSALGTFGSIIRAYTLLNTPTSTTVCETEELNL